MFSCENPFANFIFSAQRGFAGSHNTITVKSIFNSCFLSNISQQSPNAFLDDVKFSTFFLFTKVLYHCLYLITAVPIPDILSTAQVGPYLKRIISFVNATIDKRSVGRSQLFRDGCNVHHVDVLKVASDNECRMRELIKYAFLSTVYDVLVCYVFMQQLVYMHSPR